MDYLNVDGVYIPLDKELTQQEAKRLIDVLRQYNLSLPRGFELATQGYGWQEPGDEYMFVGTPPEEYDDVLETYDVFMFWRS